MKKPDEIEYFAAIRAKGRGIFADTVAERLGIEWNRAEYLLYKWVRAGWWEYGISLRSGGLTDEAPLKLSPWYRPGLTADQYRAVERCLRDGAILGSVSDSTVDAVCAILANGGLTP